MLIQAQNHFFSVSSYRKVNW